MCSPSLLILPLNFLFPLPPFALPNFIHMRAQMRFPSFGSKLGLPLPLGITGALLVIAFVVAMRAAYPMLIVGGGHFLSGQRHPAGVALVE